MSKGAPTLHLFEGVGIELEYMIVDRETLSVRPVADHVLRSDRGEIESEIEHGEIAWSNELVLHVIELKTNGPAASFEGLADLFASNVREIDRRLEPEGARLMPSAMHPLMDPSREMHLWPHEYSRVYETFNRIFDCRGHGWANLQSVHINLPFCGDEEFGRLHAAIRFALPLLPALSASSPFVEGIAGPALSSRLEFYRENARRVRSVSGSIVPEPAYTRAAYESEILERIYRDLAPLDPEGVLHHEWINARGCIARFDRNAIEIRVLDITECPQSDLAIAEAIVALVEALVDGLFVPYERQCGWSTESLATLLRDVGRRGGHASIQAADYLEAWGWKGEVPCSAGALWRHILERIRSAGRPLAGWPMLDAILRHGCLAQRLWERLGPTPSRASLLEEYMQLCRCLAEGALYLPELSANDDDAKDGEG